MTSLLSVLQIINLLLIGLLIVGFVLIVVSLWRISMALRSVAASLRIMSDARNQLHE